MVNNFFSYSSPMKRKRRTVVNNMMEVFENVLLNASEFIKGKFFGVNDCNKCFLFFLTIILGRLFFVSLNTDVKPKSTPSVHYFTIDTELNYDSFYLDFGPLNLSMLYHYCVKLRRKLNNPAFHNKKVVHYTGADVQKRVNAAFLIGAYSVSTFQVYKNIFVLVLVASQFFFNTKIQYDYHICC